MDEKKAGDLRKMNAAALAYIGDAVYEAAVRESCIRAGKTLSADRLHSAAVRYVRASAQAKAMRALFSALNAEDALLVKRAKNRKPRSIPKNADPVEYKWATALEALMGYYYLAGEKEKLSRLIEDTMAVIDGEYLA